MVVVNPSTSTRSAVLYVKCSQVSSFVVSGSHTDTQRRMREAAAPPQGNKREREKNVVTISQVSTHQILLIHHTSSLHKRFDTTYQLHQLKHISVQVALKYPKHPSHNPFQNLHG